MYEITKDMLLAELAKNNTEAVIRFSDGVDVTVTVYTSDYETWYWIAWGQELQGCDNLVEAVQICNRHAEITRRNDEEKQKLRAYFEKHIKDGNYTADEWGWYSDWHKDCYGYRPHGIVCGEYINPHAAV